MKALYSLCKTSIPVMDVLNLLQENMINHFFQRNDIAQARGNIIFRFVTIFIIFNSFPLR